MNVFEYRSHELSRRRLLKLAAYSWASLMLAGCDLGRSVNTPPRKAQLKTGCYSASYAGFSSQELGCGLLNSFGDPSFDRRFFEELQIQNAFWGLARRIAVYPFDECSVQTANAVSFPSGVILFGYWMTVKTIMQTGTELPVAGILAHEWAHQAQFEFNWIRPDASTARNTELEADAFAGYYLAIAKNWAGSQLNSFVQAVFNIGDFQFNSPSHHGTPQERSTAASLGMQVGYEVLSREVLLSYQELHQIFVRNLYINGLTEEPSEVFKLSRHAESLESNLDQVLLQKIRKGEATPNQLHTPTYPASFRRRFFMSP
jgi:hypothetical protein